VGRMAEHNGPTWASLAEIALYGLRETYGVDSGTLPYTRRFEGDRVVSAGHSIRYALICLLGLQKASATLESAVGLAGDLWNRIRRVATTGLTAGDLGLGLWAQSLYPNEVNVFTAAQTLSKYRNRPEVCDSVDLAWLLLGCDHAISAGLDRDQAEQLGELAKGALLGLYNPQTALFYRHARHGSLHAVSRRIVCFANQIYPIMALSVHVHRTGHQDAAEAARAVADHLCRLQGDLGQWWWLYDARRGRVVDGYPVFSVHQHGMAPMALYEASKVCGRSYAEAIKRGLGWPSNGNELSTDMVLRQQGMILRNIHRRGYGRVRRMIHGTLWCCGWRRDCVQDTPGVQYAINPECRPYELGWLLYAAGSILQAAGSKVTAEEGEACRR